MFHSLKAQSAFPASSFVPPWLNHLLLAATLNLPFSRPTPVYPAPTGCLADVHSSCHDFLSLTQRSPHQCPLPADGATVHPIPEPGAWPSRLFSPLLPHLQSGTESFRSHIHPLLSLSALMSQGVATSGPRHLDPNPCTAGHQLWDLRLASSPLSDPQLPHIEERFLAFHTFSKH